MCPPRASKEVYSSKLHSRMVGVKPNVQPPGEVNVKLTLTTGLYASHRGKGGKFFFLVRRERCCGSWCGFFNWKVGWCRGRGEGRKVDGGSGRIGKGELGVGVTVG